MKKKKEEKAILDIFINSNYGNEYINEKIIESERPDFIIDNEGFEITKITDEKGLIEHEAYIKFCKYLEKEVKNKFSVDYTFLFIHKSDKYLEYNKIKKVVRNELIKIIGENISLNEIECDFYHQYKYRNNILFNYFDCIYIRKATSSLYFGPGKKMEKFSVMYKKCLEKKEKKKYDKKGLKNINLIIFCCFDTFFSIKEIETYKENGYISKDFKNIYVILKDKNKNNCIIKMQ